MAVTPLALFGPAQLANAVATIYTAPANSRIVLTRVVFTNVSAATRTVTVHVVRSGGSAASGNILINAKPVSVDESWVCNELAGMVLGAGDFVAAFADSATSVNYFGSGWQSQ